MSSPTISSKRAPSSKKAAQKGPQRKILREGTYALNLAQFVVLTKERNYAVALNTEDLQLFFAMAAQIEGRSGFEPVVIKDSDDVDRHRHRP